MLKIKLVRFGRKKNPTYRIAVAEERSKATGKVIESLGFYNPSVKPPKLSVKNELLKKWLGKGTQPTPSVRKLLNL